MRDTDPENAHHRKTPPGGDPRDPYYNTRPEAAKLEAVTPKQSP